MPYSGSEDASASVAGDALPNANLQHTITQLDNPRISMVCQDGTGRKQEGLSHPQLNDLSEQATRSISTKSPSVSGLDDSRDSGHTSQVLLQGYGAIRAK